MFTLSAPTIIVVDSSQPSWHKTWTMAAQGESATKPFCQTHYMEHCMLLDVEPVKDWMSSAMSTCLELPRIASSWLGS